MTQYEVSVSFGEQGFNKIANIFGVIKLIRKYSHSAEVSVRKFKYYKGV